MLIDKIEEMALYEYDDYALNRRASAGLPGISGMRGDSGYDERYSGDRRVNEQYSDNSRESRSGAGEITLSQSHRGDVNRVKVNNRINYIIAEEGDTYESVTADFNLRRWELERYNEFSDTTAIRAGMILYLQPKRARAEVGKDFHTIGADENLYIVSQKYGVKMDALRKRNSIPDGVDPPPGTELWLRREKPEALIRYYIP